MSSQSEYVYYKELEKNNNTHLARTLKTTNTGLKGKSGPACSSGRPHHSQVVLKRWRRRPKTFAAVTAWRNVSPAWVAKVNRTAGSTCVRASLLGGNQLSNHVLDGSPGAQTPGLDLVHLGWELPAHVPPCQPKGRSAPHHRCPPLQSPVKCSVSLEGVPGSITWQGSNRGTASAAFIMA